MRGLKEEVSRDTGGEIPGSCVLSSEEDKVITSRWKSLRRIPKMSSCVKSLRKKRC